MEKSEQVPKWENLSRDILGVIFGKLEMMDVTMGASRVCTSWFLATQNTTLWNTVNLVVSHGNSFFYNLRVNPPKLGEDIRKRDWFRTHKISGRYLTPYGPQFRQIKQGQNNLGNLLIEITKLSCTAPTNLFFNFYSCIQDKELVLAAERMPNVEKLVLPMWCTLSENSFRFAFSQWKNLRTLVIVKNPLNTGTLELQTVGENFTNLTNLKFVGLLDEHLADQIVLHLQVLKRLSLRCSVLYDHGLLSRLVNGLENLEILNLSHSMVVRFTPSVHISTVNEIKDTLSMVTPKIHKLITCPPFWDCRICNNWLITGESWKMCQYIELFWQKDEIEEFKF